MIGAPNPRHVVVAGLAVVGLAQSMKALTEVLQEIVGPAGSAGVIDAGAGPLRQLPPPPERCDNVVILNAKTFRCDAPAGHPPPHHHLEPAADGPVIWHRDQLIDARRPGS